MMETDIMVKILITGRISDAFFIGEIRNYWQNSEIFFMKEILTKINNY